MDALAACMEVALQVCKTKTGGRSGKHMQPRGVGRKRRAMANQYRAVVELQQQVARVGGAQGTGALTDLTTNTSDPRAAGAVAARLAAQAGPASEALGEEGRRLKAEMKVMDAEHRQACKEADTKAQRRLRTLCSRTSSRTDVATGTLTAQGLRKGISPAWGRKPGRRGSLDTAGYRHVAGGLRTERARSAQRTGGKARRMLT